MMIALRNTDYIQYDYVNINIALKVGYRAKHFPTISPLRSLRHLPRSQQQHRLPPLP